MVQESSEQTPRDVKASIHTQSPSGLVRRPCTPRVSSIFSTGRRTIDAHEEIEEILGNRQGLDIMLNQRHAWDRLSNSAAQLSRWPHLQYLHLAASLLQVRRCLSAIPGSRSGHGRVDANFDCSTHSL